MSETLISNEPESPARPGSCEICGGLNAPLITAANIPAGLSKLLQANTETFDDLAQVCVQCVELFSRAKTQIDSHNVVFEQTDHVLPTPLRMNADERFTGRGVTIAFLDSG